MGLFSSVTKALFGGESSKQKSESGNKFADQINKSFSPWVSQGTAGYGQAANILGLGGEGARTEALDDWWKSSGGDFLLDQGLDQITGNAAAGGLLRSGSTLKAMENYRSNLASTKLSEYFNMLQGFNQQALGAGSLISNAGQYSKGSGSSSEDTGGLGKAIGTALAIIGSDRRLKTDIEKIGEQPDGLGVYRYRYLWDEPDTVHTGVMADEVAEHRPWALGPEINGYQTVAYALLESR